MLTVNDVLLLLLSFEKPHLLTVLGIQPLAVIHSYSTLIQPSTRSKAPPLKALVLSTSDAASQKLETPITARISGCLAKLPLALRADEDLSTFDVVLITSSSQMKAPKMTEASQKRELQRPAMFTISGKVKSKTFEGWDAWTVDAGNKPDRWIVG